MKVRRGKDTTLIYNDSSFLHSYDLMMCNNSILYYIVFIQGNTQCKQIPWDDDASRYLAFKEGRTGYPYIDAIMAQLRTEGSSALVHGDGDVIA